MVMVCPPPDTSRGPPACCSQSRSFSAHQRVQAADELAVVALPAVVGDVDAHGAGRARVGAGRCRRRVEEGRCPCAGAGSRSGRPAGGQLRRQFEPRLARGTFGALQPPHDQVRQEHDRDSGQAGDEVHARQPGRRSGERGRAARRTRSSRRLVGLRPTRADHEHDHDDDAEEHPAVDDVVDAGRDLVAREVAQHDDDVRAQPVGHQGHQERNDHEHGAPLPRPVVEVGKQGAHHERCDEVAHAAALLHHRPAARRNDELQAFAVHRDAGELQREHHEVGRPLHQRGQHELAEGHREEQEQQREQDGQRHLETQHRRHGQHQQRHHRKLPGGVDHHQVGQQPHRGHRQQRQQHPGLRAGRQRSQPLALAPHQPQADDRHQHAVREGVGAQPDLHHGQAQLAVQQQDGGQQQREDRQRGAPRRGGDGGGEDGTHASRLLVQAVRDHRAGRGGAQAARWRSSTARWAAQV